jgi:NAD+ diphosphatase
MITYQGFELKFCPECKHPLVKGDVANSRMCSRDKKMFYVNPSTCVNIYIVKNDDVLLAKRAIEPAKGAYDSVGGFVDSGENLEEAAIREAKEETGLDIILGEYLGSTKDYYGSKDKPLVCAGFIARMTDEQAVPVPDDDVAELFWHPIHDTSLKFPFLSTNYLLKKLRERYTA